MAIEFYSFVPQQNPNIDVTHNGQPLSERAQNLAIELLNVLEDPDAKLLDQESASELSIAASLASHIVDILKTLPKKK